MKRPEKDLKNPPGQIVSPSHGYVTLADYIEWVKKQEEVGKHNQAEWKRLQEQRNNNNT